MRFPAIDGNELHCRLLANIFEEIGIVAACSAPGLAHGEQVTSDRYRLLRIDICLGVILGTEPADGLDEIPSHAENILAAAFADQAVQAYANHKGIMLLSKLFSAKHRREAVQVIEGNSLGRN
jgi:hypothetical protein